MIAIEFLLPQMLKARLFEQRYTLYSGNFMLFVIVSSYCVRFCILCRGCKLVCLLAVRLEDARRLGVNWRGYACVLEPRGFLVEEPEVSCPEEKVQKAQNNRNVQRIKAADTGGTLRAGVSITRPNHILRISRVLHAG